MRRCNDASDWGVHRKWKPANGHFLPFSQSCSSTYNRASERPVPGVFEAIQGARSHRSCVCVNRGRTSVYLVNTPGVPTQGNDHLELMQWSGFIPTRRRLSILILQPRHIRGFVSSAPYRSSLYIYVTTIQPMTGREWNGVKAKKER